MTGAERGFLLLTSHLGDPARKPLSVAQFRTLAERAGLMTKPGEDRELTCEDLVNLGYDRNTAFHILELLNEEYRLEKYLQKGQKHGCVPITRIGDRYPLRVRKKLDLDAPGCLWAKGNVELLKTPAVSLVGSRELAEPNRLFTEVAGLEAARQGITLISGNARGADRTAQEACLNAGGCVICVVADELEKYPAGEKVLYLSEDGFDLPFTATRALSRNRVIHALGLLTIVAQCSFGSGGTWDGTMKNLQNGWSPVFCYDDGTAAFRELEQIGAKLIALEELTDFSALRPDTQSFL